MGLIYKRKYKRADGTIAESPVWCIKYYRNGIAMRMRGDRQGDRRQEPAEATRG